MVLNAPSSIQDQSHVSPDGRWITYNSDESGTWEVYTASFPDLTGKRQISIDGGMQPLWRRDGQELFYLSPQGQLMAVDVHVSESTSIETGAPRALFRTGLNPSVPGRGVQVWRRTGSAFFSWNQSGIEIRRSRCC